MIAYYNGKKYKTETAMPSSIFAYRDDVVDLGSLKMYF